MLAFILRRILQSVAVMAVVALIAFSLFNFVGDPVVSMVGQDATMEEKARLRSELGLDQPVVLQFFHFVGNAVQGDFGRSLRQGRSVAVLIKERLPATLELSFGAALLALVVGIPAGVYAALQRGSWGAQLLLTASLIGVSLPSFLIGILLILVFAVQLGWLPSTGRGQTAMLFGVPWSFLTLDGLRHMVMPALNLSLFNISLVLRLTRSGVRETVLMDYVKFARAKGLTPRRVIMVHVLKNIMIPVVTVVGLQFGSTIAFSVVTESVFAWPGMGKLLIDSIGVLDRPVIVAYLLVIVTIFIVINLVVDVLYSALDPRVRLSESKG